jgi:hypothetical protein
LQLRRGCGNLNRFTDRSDLHLDGEIQAVIDIQANSLGLKLFEPGALDGQRIVPHWKIGHEKDAGRSRLRRARHAGASIVNRDIRAGDYGARRIGYRARNVSGNLLCPQRKREKHEQADFSDK